MATELSRQLAALGLLKKKLEKLNKAKITDEQASTLRDLIRFLNGSGGSSPTETSSDSTFSTAEVIFIQSMKARKIHPEIITHLKKTMKRVIDDPTSGKHLADSKYAQIFRDKFDLPEESDEGKIFIMKAYVRLKYRLIYAYGASLKRPLFLDFAHRKDIYKHVGFGYTSS